MAGDMLYDLEHAEQLSCCMQSYCVHGGCVSRADQACIYCGLVSLKRLCRLGAEEHETERTNADGVLNQSYSLWLWDAD